MSDHLQEMLDAHAARTGTPGVAVGVYLDGEEFYAYHGVTSVENPLPVDANTLFQFGSTGKTFTATAMMRLVEAGKVDLDATVRTYLPEFAVADEEASATVTVLQLFNHTAGWSGDFMGTGQDLSDDALAKFVTAMSTLAQERPVGTGVSYNNASLSLAGRVIEKVTGKRFEDAMAELIFAPLGLEHSFFFADDVMTRRFVVGHNAGPDGTFTVARPWALPRAGAAAGGITANAGDQVAWIRFHLGDGTAKDGTRLLSQENLDRMKQPTAHMPGAALGDAVGISWMLRDVDGVQAVSHGGSTIGQQSAFEMVPERKFGIAVLTNGGLGRQRPEPRAGPRRDGPLCGRRRDRPGAVRSGCLSFGGLHRGLRHHRDGDRRPREGWRRPAGRDDREAGLPRVHRGICRRLRRTAGADRAHRCGGRQVRRLRRRREGHEGLLRAQRCRRDLRHAHGRTARRSGLSAIRL